MGSGTVEIYPRPAYISWHWYGHSKIVYPDGGVIGDYYNLFLGEVCTASYDALGKLNNAYFQVIPDCNQASPDWGVIDVQYRFADDVRLLKTAKMDQLRLNPKQ